MSANKITAAEWLKSELFINNTLPILFIIIGFCGFGVLLLGLYASKNRFRAIALISFTLIGIILSVFCYSKIEGFKDFNELAKNQSYAIRDRRKRPFVYEYENKYPATEIDALKLDKLKFYDKEAIIDFESVTFLGKTEHIYYVKIFNNLYNINLNSPNIVFEDTYEKAVRTGYTYHLKENDYLNLGFYEEVGPIYTKIIVPSKLKNMEYIDLDERSKPLEF